MSTQNLQQKNGTLMTVNQKVFIYENPIKFLTSSLESIYCHYSDAYIFVTGNIAIEGANINKKLAFKNWAPFRKCRT